MIGRNLNAIRQFARVLTRTSTSFPNNSRSTPLTAVLAGVKSATRRSMVSRRKTCISGQKWVEISDIRGAAWAEFGVGSDCFEVVNDAARGPAFSLVCAGFPKCLAAHYAAGSSS